MEQVTPLSRSALVPIAIAILMAAVLPGHAGVASSGPSAVAGGSRPILFVMEEADHRNLDIYAVRPGGEPSPLTQTSDKIEMAPEWSPDGTKFAFDMRDAVPYGECCDEPTADIYVMNADGTGLRRVTNHPANEVNPTWSPDGRTIAFISDRSDFRERTSARIFTVRSDGSSTRARPISNIQAREIAWSPKGPVIAIADGTYGERNGIRLLNLRTGRLRWVTQSSTEVWSVDWAPSGAGLAYTDNGRSRNGARLIRIDGTRDRRVPTSGLDRVQWSTMTPAWGDGSWVAYVIRGSDGHDDNDNLNTSTELRAVTLKGASPEEALVSVGSAYIHDVAW